MRYRLRFEVMREREPGKARIADPEGWAPYSARTAILELPDHLDDDAVEDAIDKAAVERRITAGVLGMRR